MMPGPVWIDAKVIGQRHWTDALLSMVVSAEPVNFEAGQFTRLALCIEGELVARPYSFVNAPGEETCEFYYVIVPGGPLTTRMAALGPGEDIFLSRQSSGFLVLSEVPDADQLWLLSTGTGIGPFLSMLATPVPWQRFRQVILAQGVRHVAELAYAERIAALQMQYGSRLHQRPLLTREGNLARPGALAGRIPVAIERGELERAAGLALSASASQVMLCGNPAMVSDTIEILKTRGMKKHRRRDPGQITVENYW